MIELSIEEAKALFDLIDELSGFNASNVFAWDGTDYPDDPTTRACVKIFRAAGRKTPANCEGKTEEAP